VALYRPLRKALSAIPPPLIQNLFIRGLWTKGQTRSVLNLRNNLSIDGLNSMGLAARDENLVIDQLYDAALAAPDAYQKAKSLLLAGLEGEKKKCRVRNRF